MATRCDMAVSVPVPVRKKTVSRQQKKLDSEEEVIQRKETATGQQKRMELEEEVARLYKMLDHEEKVNKILQCVLHGPDGSIPPIPSFLPSKLKELLAELAMVEGEITRLERVISHLQHNIDQEQKGIQESKSKEWELGSLSNLAPPGNSSMPQYLEAKPKVTHERRPSEARALFFINQAIKGNYSLNGFARKENDVQITATEQLESQREVGSQEKISRKSGMLEKPSTPKKVPRHPKSKPIEHDSEISISLPQNPSYDSSSPKSKQQWQPNKLSKSIMKCLMCILMRLIRTTRQMELEKSGVIARPTHSAGSKSFRLEGTLNSKVGVSSQREIGQQDPYGIFAIEDSLPRDIGAYKNFVKCTSSSMDLKSISSCVPLLRKLRVLMDNLYNVDLRSLSYQQKLAFWSNMYNACIMHGILQFGLPSNQKKMLQLMNKAVLNIGGNKLNALTIEHFILGLPPSSKEKGEKDNKENLVRSTYGLEHPNPNVRFALCSGSKSSPAVRIYTADGILAELEKSKLEYLQASIVVTSNKKLMIPELLLQNMLYFARDMESLVEWVCNQLPTSGSLRKSMVDCLRSKSNEKIADVVEIMPYEFEFQYLLVM